jgi:hypothetical protein
MTMPMEFEEPREVPWSRLVETKCRKCGEAPAFAIPEKAHIARCIECGREDAGIDWPWFTPVGVWHPTVRFGTYAVTLPPEVREAYPAPEVTTRGGWPPDIAVPSPAALLAEHAREASWEVRLAYSRGCAPHGSTGRPLGLKHYISLRFGGHPMTDCQAYAVYSKSVTGGTWSWEDICIWGPDLRPFGMCSLAELKDWLTERDIPIMPMLAWVDMIRTDREKAEAARKLKAATTVKKLTSKRESGG